MTRTCYLVRDETPIRQARFPVIDAHNHLWGNWAALENVVKVMDEAGVVIYCDLTSNVSLAWGGGGYMITPGDIGHFFRECADRYPHRFYGFTTATLTPPTGPPLFNDAKEFVEGAIRTLRDHVARGARGLKVLKELGLQYRDGQGRLIHCDDPRLGPIWEEAAALGVPVLIHQADPFGFFQPVAPENEHYDTLQKYPAWGFSGPDFPRFEELQRRYRNLLRNHPRTTFLLPHMANWPENLSYVGQLLDECPNVFVDFSARMDELGRQPYRTRQFLLAYQDRIYFGSDMPASLEMYRCYFRFLETFDEYFVPPDYDGTFGRHRWRVHGLGLPDGVLKKIYHENALKLIPRLREDWDQLSGGPGRVAGPDGT
jgi:predicted TIM-barrel fold metal-dependent hydrolase